MDGWGTPEHDCHGPWQPLLFPASPFPACVVVSDVCEPGPSGGDDDNSVKRFPEITAGSTKSLTDRREMDKLGDG